LLAVLLWVWLALLPACAGAADPKTLWRDLMRRATAVKT
jgi:hypothetical protein